MGSLDYGSTGVGAGNPPLPPSAGASTGAGNGAGVEGSAGGAPARQAWADLNPVVKGKDEVSL